MKRKNLFLLMFICFAVLSISPAVKSATVVFNQPDPRVAKALKAEEIEYRLTEGGDYEVTYNTKGDRKQTAVIVSQAEVLYGIELRGVMSLAAMSKTRFDPNITDQLLEDNISHFSAWGIIRIDKDFSLFSIEYVSANADGKVLKAALSSVMTQADAMEEKIMKGDKF